VITTCSTTISWAGERISSILRTGRRVVFWKRLRITSRVWFWIPAQIIIARLTVVDWLSSSGVIGWFRRTNVIVTW
jgi:hypothetical protein